MSGLPAPTTTLPRDTPSLPRDLDFADQRGGMKSMGMVIVVNGAFATLYALLLALPQLAEGTRLAARNAVTAGMYLLAAVALTAAGVGSMRARRWCRPVMLIVTGTWVLRGVFGLITWLAVGPDLERAVAAMSAASTGPTTASSVPAQPGAPLTAGKIRVVTAIMILVFGVLLPGGYFWFYVRRSVRQTLDFFSPAPAWTDRCPTPALALSVWLAIGSLFAFSFMLTGVVPFFGRLVTGAPTLIALAAMGALLALLAFGAYRLRPLAWFASVLLVLTLAASSVMTFSRVDPLEVDRLAGATPETIATMEQMGATSRSATVFTTVLYAVGALAYLMWVLPYFRRRMGNRRGGIVTS